MRKKNTEALDDVLQQFFSGNPVFMQKLGENRILNGWKEVMGETIASYTTNLYFRNNVLFVSVSSAALRSELLMNRQNLVKKLNDHARMKIISDIVIR